MVKELKKFVRYNEVSLHQGSFSIFYYYWGKKIVRFIEDFVIQVLVKSRFHCILVIWYRDKTISFAHM